MEVIGFTSVASTRMPRITSITYRTGDWSPVPKNFLSEAIDLAFQQALRRFELGELNMEVDVRDRKVNLGDWVDAVWVEAGELWVRIKAHESGAGISPYLVYGHLLQMDAEVLRSTPIAKNEFGTERRQ
jgi:hypothetical protein